MIQKLLIAITLTLFVIGIKAEQTPIITKWNTFNSKFIVIETIGSYNYKYTNIAQPNITGTGYGNYGYTKIDFPVSGKYSLEIIPELFNGDFKLWMGKYSMALSDKKKLYELSQWGNSPWNIYLDNMFQGCSNLNITATDTPKFGNVLSIASMFSGCENLSTIPNINLWNTSSVTNMQAVFGACPLFNENVGSWNTSNVTTMYEMFAGATVFNQNIGNWDTSNVTKMSSMFYSAESFNQNIGSWNTWNVQDMSAMFWKAYAFNQDIGNWNTEYVSDMQTMFFLAKSFNQNIGNWNTASVTTMNAMFYAAESFNQDIGNWNTSNVTESQSMFQAAILFNQNLKNWNVAKITNMSDMFYNARSFNQNIGDWKLNAIVKMNGLLDFAPISCENYTKTLNGWAANINIPTNRNLSAFGIYYGAGALSARSYLINKGWTIENDAFDANCMYQLSTEQLNRNQIEIFPNPTNDFIYFKSPEKIQNVELLTSEGKVITYKVDMNMINVKNLTSGLYFLKIKLNDGSEITKKIIKK